MDVATVARASLEGALPVYYKFYRVGETLEEAIATIVDGDSTPEEAMDWAQREARSISP